jgi:hypothetical protein
MDDICPCLDGGEGRVVNLRRWLGLDRNAIVQRDGGDDVNGLRERCADLEERLRNSEASLRERSHAFYDLQQQYSKEHFELFESMRNLKIERMRNAGAYAGLDVVLGRAKGLQERIADLKARLRRYERVDDRHEDTAVLVGDEPPKRPSSGDPDL